MPQPERLIADAAECDGLGLRKEDAAFIECLWQSYRPFAERNWVTSFKNPAKMQSAFWEMYLTCVLLQDGHRIVDRPEPQGGRCGPDVPVEEGNQRIWFEAHAPPIAVTDQMVFRTIRVMVSVGTYRIER